jgi:hypothetical protein
MNKFVKENVILVSTTLAAIAAGYWFFRFSYNVSAPFPFSQEIMLLLLGAIVTGSITAVLLNRQTVNELKKEESVKFLNIKMEIYQSLMDGLEASIVAGETTREDIIRLRFLAQRLALVASPAVLEQFGAFLRVYSNVSRDHDLHPGEEDTVMEALAYLTVTIREELGELSGRTGRVASSVIKAAILKNSGRLPES